MNIERITKAHKEAVAQFFAEHWGSAEMIVTSGVYDCRELDGFIAFDKTVIVGLLTFEQRGEEIEIISLDSQIEGQGIGSALLKRVEQIAQDERCQKVTLLTTNDNMKALAFYQKRGYRLTAIFQEAVTQARVLKPSIPLIGEEGIPLRDEILLEKRFDS